MSLRLENKVALVTGAGSGLGEATAGRFAEEGAHVYVTDLNRDSAERVAKEINGAGNVEDTTLDDWRKTQAVNLEAVFMGCRAAVKAMKEKGGSIINISSIEGIVGEPNVAAYNASKGGVRIFTKSAALHCAAEGYGIRVNSVHPGFILTPMVIEGIGSMPQEVQDEMNERLMREIPLQAMGEPLDIANGCLFLASDESKYMTGSELIIDGGYTCH